MDAMIHNELQIGKAIGLFSMRAEEHILIQVTPALVDRATSFYSPPTSG